MRLQWKQLSLTDSNKTRCVQDDWTTDNPFITAFCKNRYRDYAVKFPAPFMGHTPYVRYLLTAFARGYSTGPVNQIRLVVPYRYQYRESDTRCITRGYLK